MHCPFCGADDTRVIDSRLVSKGDQVRRRRECSDCAERLPLMNQQTIMPRIIKQNGAREPFNEDKLPGFLRALEKRPVSLEDTEAEIIQIKHALRAMGGLK